MLRPFPNTAAPPDPAGPLVRNHAGADGIAWVAGFAIESALVGILLSQHYLGAIATGWHLAGPLAIRPIIVGKAKAGIPGGKFRTQGVA